MHRGKTERISLDAQIEPFRADNAKLVKENNELHLQLLKLREDFDSQIRGSPLFISSLYKRKFRIAEFLENFLIFFIRTKG